MACFPLYPCWVEPRHSAIICAVFCIGFAACGKTGDGAAPSGNGSSTSGQGSGGTASGGTGTASGGTGGGAGNTSAGGASTTGYFMGPDCPAGSSPGCCYGDGGCCSCVGKVCDDWALGTDPGIFELTQCVCQQGVCADACKAACAKQGIDSTCGECVKDAVSGVCSDQFEVCVEATPEWCPYSRQRLLGVCLGPFGSMNGGSAGAAGAPSDGTVFSGCTETECSLMLTGEVVALGTGGPPGCDHQVFPSEDLENGELEWFSLATDQGMVTIGFNLPTGGPPVNVGDSLQLSYVRAASAESVSVQSGGELLAHATRGQQLLPLNELEIERGIAMCDEQYAACRTVGYRLDASFDDDSVSLMPGEVRPLGVFDIALEEYREFIDAEAGVTCDASELSFAVLRR